MANNIHDVDEFGDLPQALLDPLSQILSRRRVLTSRTLKLFLRPDLVSIDLYDCGSTSYHIPWTLNVLTPSRT